MPYQPIIFEEWKDINFFGIRSNSYLISNFGRVFSYLKNGIISPAISNGYLTIQLMMESGDRKTFYIHRLVAMAFIENPNPDILVEVNHKNLKRNDCFSENLEWVTKRENIIHELDHKNHGIKQEQASKKWSDGSSTYGENNGMAKLTEKEVRTMLSVIENGGSYSDALNSINMLINDKTRANLSHIARGHRWKYLQREYNIPDKIPR